MNLNVLLNIGAIAVSAIALIVSSFLAGRQLRSTRSSNDTIIALDWLSRELISDNFLESEAYILDGLAKEHSPEAGVSLLLPTVRKHVHRVGRYYASLGHLVVFGAADERLVLSIVHWRLRAAWYVLEPYIRVERERRGAPFFSFFEHIACRASEVDTSELHRVLKLRTFPPTDDTQVTRLSRPGSPA